MARTQTEVSGQEQAKAPDFDRWMIAGMLLLIGLVAGLAIYARGTSSAPSTAVAPIVAPTTNAAASSLAAPTAAAIQPTVAVAVAAAPTAAAIQPTVAVAVAAAPTAVPAAPACTEITGLPLVAGATCVDHDIDSDDGITKIENTYHSTVPTDEVRRFFEQAFAQNGWTISEVKIDAEDGDWSYQISQNLRQFKVEGKPQILAQGTGTKIKITER